MEKIVLRRAKREEVPLYVEFWLQNYSFCFSGEYAQAMHESAGENSLCVADEKDVPVGFTMGIKLNKGTASAGFLVVRDDWKGRGLGKRLFGTILERFQNYNLAINSMEDKLVMYEKMGFTVRSFATLIKGGIPNTGDFKHYPSDHFNIVPYTVTVFEQLVAYDMELHCGIQRRTLLKSLLENIKGTRAFVAIDENSIIIGYTNILPANGNFDYSVYPLYGDSTTVTRQLLAKVLDILPRGKSVYLCVPEVNTTSVAMLESVELKTIAREIRMYTKRDVALPLHKITSTLTHITLC